MWRCNPTHKRVVLMARRWTSPRRGSRPYSGIRPNSTLTPREQACECFTSWWDHLRCSSTRRSLTGLEADEQHRGCQRRDRGTRLGVVRRHREAALRPFGVISDTLIPHQTSSTRGTGVLCASTSPLRCPLSRLDLLHHGLRPLFDGHCSIYDGTK